MIIQEDFKRSELGKEEELGSLNRGQIKKKGNELYHFNAEIQMDLGNFIFNSF